MNFEALTALGALIGAAGTIVALPISYIFTNQRISKHRRRDEYLRSTDVKVRDLLNELVILRAEISAWSSDSSEMNTREIMRVGAKLNSRLNFELNEASKSDCGGGVEWLSIKTDDFEAALADMHEDRRILGAKTLGNQLARLTTELADLNRTKRPND